MKLICALASTTLALSITSVAAAENSVTDAYGGAGTDIPTTVVTPTEGTVTPLAAEETEGTTESPTVAGATATKPAATAPASSTAPVAVASPSAPEPVSSGSLPFTGLDIGLMAAGGVLLLGFGLAMRRLTQRSAPLA
jgi:hypothetical protein